VLTANYRSFRNRKFWITVLALLVAGVIYYPLSPAGRQASDARILEAFEQRVRDRLAQEPATANPSGGRTSHPQLRLFYSDRGLSDEQWEDVVRIISQERDAFDMLPPVSVSQFEPSSTTAGRYHEWGRKP
jgi:hypothetical protein